MAGKLKMGVKMIDTFYLKGGCGWCSSRWIKLKHTVYESVVALSTICSEFAKMSNLNTVNVNVPENSCNPWQY